MFFCLDEDVDFFNYCLSRLQIPFTRCTSPEDATVLLHTAHPWDSSWIERAEQAIPLAQKVIVVTTEVHPPIVEWLSKLDENVDVYTCGWIYNLRAKQYFYMDWFALTAHLYKLKPYLLEKAEKTDTSTVRFNALLGRKKPHRDIVYNFLKDRTDTVCTYLQTKMGTIDPDSFNDPAKFIWECQQQPVDWTVEYVNYEGESVCLSQIIPLQIYADTDWCIVAETNYQTEFAFFTEKTAKPILAKKPFIMVGNPHSLQTLHRLGFKTFDSVIDESYDNSFDLEKRVGMAMQQVDRLANMTDADRASLNEKIIPILEHNQKVMLETDWQILQNDHLMSLKD